MQQPVTGPEPAQPPHAVEGADAWPETDDLQVRAARRVIDARDDYYLAARAYGLDVEAAVSGISPFAPRVDAWLARSANLLGKGVSQRLGARVLDTVSTDPPPPLLIDRLDPSGHSILYGTGGTGKGVLACQWLIGLRTAGHRILIADYENHPDEWARRVYGLGGADLMDGIVVVTPLTAAWGGRRGPLWQQADDFRALVAETGSTYLYVDSIVPACAGTDPLKPEAVALYTGGLELIGLPALSLAHVPKDGDLRYPFGSVFWHNLARVTYSLERSRGLALLTNHKANNYLRRARQAIEVSWSDDRPQSVYERPYQMLLSSAIETALMSGPLSVTQIVDFLNDENDDEDADAIKPNSVRVALQRGQKEKPPRFVKDGERWSRG